MPAKRGRGRKRKASGADEEAAAASSSRPPAKTRKQSVTDLMTADDFVLPSGSVMLGTGDNSVGGQLGVGDRWERSVKPRRVDSFPPGGQTIRQITCGSMHSLALLDGGEVYSWGVNDDGQLGRKLDEEENPEGEPRLVKVPGPSKTVQVSAGESHSVALKENGDVYAWGAFRSGQQGAMFLTEPIKSKEDAPKSPVILHDATKTNQKVVKIASGENHVLLLLSNGDVMSTGYGFMGQLGQTSGRKARMQEVVDDDQKYEFFRQVGQVRCKRRAKFTNVWAGAYCSFGQLKSGHIMSWGANGYKQLGIWNDGDEEFIHFPSDADLYTNTIQKQECRAISGEKHIIIQTTSGRLFGAGLCNDGTLGQLFEGENHIERQPILITLPNGLDATSIGVSCGASVCAASNGGAYGWGFNCEGMLGLGAVEDEDGNSLAVVSEPRRMVSKHLEDDMRVVQVAQGSQHTILLATRENGPTTSAVSPVAPIPLLEEPAAGIVQEEDSMEQGEEEVQPQEDEGRREQDVYMNSTAEENDVANNEEDEEQEAVNESDLNNTTTTEEEDAANNSVFFNNTTVSVPESDLNSSSMTE